MKKTKRNTIELYSEWYFEELVQKGIALGWLREPKVIALEPVSYPFEKHFVRKETEIHSLNILPKMEYTYDYRVRWHPDARNLFYDIVQKNDPKPFKYGRPIFIANVVNYEDEIHHETYFDVKPSHTVARFGKTSSSISFVYKQRLIWDHLGIFIDKFIPIPMAGSGNKSARFPNTFTPKRYLLTDGGQQVRKIRFPIQNLDGFLLKRKVLLQNS